MLKDSKIEKIRENLALFKKDHKLISDQLSRQTLAILQQLDYDDRKKYYLRKLKQLEGEYFTILIYHPYKSPHLKTLKESKVFKGHLISNRGRIFDLEKNKFIKGGTSKSGYKVYLTQKYTMVIHRAMASSWLDIPDDLNGYSYGDLETNHLDGVKDNNDLPNLEWCTPEQNKLHAKETNLLINHKHILHGGVKPMRGTVIDIPGFKQRTLYVCGKEECAKLGLSNKVLYKLRVGATKSYKGCSWEEITKEEYLRNFKTPDPALISAINNYVYDRNGRKSNRTDKVTWVLTHIRTRVEKRVTGTIELAAIGTNAANMNRAYRSSGRFRNYLITKISGIDNAISKIRN